MFLKNFFLYLLIFFPMFSSANVIYLDSHQRNTDYDKYDIDELEHDCNKGNVKAKYLLALHKIHDDQKKEDGVHALEELAASDFIDAKYSLYVISKWVNVNDLTPDKALHYLIEAAEENYPLAQVDLAKAYNRGDNLKRDLYLYHYWAEKAAEQGNVDALAYTASDYYAGRGVTKDEKKGFEWLMRAYKVSGRNFTRWSMLGDAYENGLGTPIDLAKAYMCYDLDGTAGIEDKARIAPRMTPEQRSEGLRLSQEWQEKNHVYTMQSLGLTRQKDGSYQ